MKASARSMVKSRLAQNVSPPGRRKLLQGMLEERRRSIRAEFETFSRRLREEDRPDALDEGDKAAYGLAREFDSARVNRLIQMLKQIEDALSRHACGWYGRCAACEGEIPVARLRSLPFALYCRDCQDSVEANRGGMARAVP